jgi:hypothetical protein
VHEVWHCALVGGCKNAGGDMRLDEGVLGDRLGVHSGGIEVAAGSGEGERVLGPPDYFRGFLRMKTAFL